MYLCQLRKESGQASILIWLTSWKPSWFQMMTKHMNFLVPTHTNKLSLTTAKPKAKVDSYNSWNKAFRILTEIVTLKWPDQCLPMVQYTAEISDNIRKFTFAATYNYDIKFRLKKQMEPALKWNEINNSLWTKCVSSSGRDGYYPGAPSSTAFKKNNRTDHKISISPDVPDLSADSHTNATNTSSLVTTKGNVLNSSLQGHPH